MRGFRSLRQFPHIRAILFAAFACVGLIGLNMSQCWTARSERLSEARTEIANLAKSLAQHAQDRFEVADAILVGLRERVAVDGVGPAARARLEALMHLRLAAEPSIHGLSLLDETGAWLASSNAGAAIQPTFSDRAYFKFHRDTEADTVLVSGPVRSKLDGRWILFVSRRLQHADGSFAGVALAIVAADLFERFYDTFDIGGSGVINLVSDDGTQLVRRPSLDARVGRSLSASQVFQEASRGVTERTFEYIGSTDGRLRLGSMHRVPGFHLLVTVSRVRSEVLAPWARDAVTHVIWLVAIMLAVAALGVRVATQVRERTRAERLYRLLADNSSDVIICTGADGQRRYVSPSFWALTGWTEADLAGEGWSDIVPAEDRPALEALMAKLRAGASDASATYRYNCRDGRQVWVEMRARLAVPIPGEPPEFVGNIRDITRQKAAEDMLANVNDELAAMTLIDPLTEIANRRHYDRALVKAWRRSARSRTPFALLMLDVDCFKAYNDAYGHQRGDVCLKAIARALSARVRRPDDLVARYGGEEFVAILPDTTAEDGAMIAEAMRAAVAALAIEHAAGLAGVVTISIGIAAAVGDPRQSADCLVEAADIALYEAKRSGRDRVSVAAASVRQPPVLAEA